MRMVIVPVILGIVAAVSAAEPEVNVQAILAALGKDPRQPHADAPHLERLELAVSQALAGDPAQLRKLAELIAARRQQRNNAETARRLARSEASLRQALVDRKPALLDQAEQLQTARSRSSRSWSGKSPTRAVALTAVGSWRSNCIFSNAIPRLMAVSFRLAASILSGSASMRAQATSSNPNFFSFLRHFSTQLAWPKVVVLF